MRSLNQLRQHERRILAERFFREQLAAMAGDGSLAVLRDVEAFGADAAGHIHSPERVTRVQAAAVALCRAVLEVNEPEEPARHGPTGPTVTVDIPGPFGRLFRPGQGEISAGD